MLGAATIVAWGFWPGYFSPLLRGQADKPWVIHFHAAVFAAWMALLLVQALLVVIGKVSYHRRLGQVGAFYGAIVVCVGILVSISAPLAHVRAGELSPDRAGLVMLFSLTDVALFGGFFAAAMAHRNNPDLHRRLIVSATVALAGAAVGRALPSGSASYLIVWLSPLFGVIAVDLATTRRMHLVSWISLAVFALAFLKVELISWTGIRRVATT